MSQKTNTVISEPQEEIISVSATTSRRRPIAKASTASTTTGGGSHAPITRTRKSTEYEIMQRRKDVGRLRLCGYGFAEIAKRLNVSIGVIQKDMDALKEENIGRKTSFNPDEFIGAHESVLDEVSEHAWNDYHAADPGSKLRIQALDLIRTVQIDKLKVFEDIGLIVKAAQQVEHKIVHELPWTPEIRAAAADALLQSQLTPQLAEPTLDEDHVPGNNLENVTNVQDAEFTEVVAKETVSVPEPAAVQVPVLDPVVEEFDPRQETLIRQLVGSGMPLDTARKIAVEGKALAEANGAQIAKQLMDNITKTSKE